MNLKEFISISKSSVVGKIILLLLCLYVYIALISMIISPAIWEIVMLALILLGPIVAGPAIVFDCIGFWLYSKKLCIKLENEYVGIFCASIVAFIVSFVPLALLETFHKGLLPIWFYSVSLLIKCLTFYLCKTEKVKLWHLALLNIIPTIYVGLIGIIFSAG